MSELLIKQVEYGSEDYRQTLQVREQVLRIPLGLQILPKDTHGEEGHHHIAAFREGQVVASLILAPLGDSTFKIRQVSVLTSLQGTGIGRELLVWAEDFSREKQIQSIIMSARETAVGFYEKLGYKKTGAFSMEVDLPHWTMEKKL